MAAQVTQDYIKGPRPAKLDGDPVVTYPYGTSHKRVERYFTLTRGVTLKSFLAAAPAPNETCVLTERANLAGDHVDIGVYEVYEDLPGPWVYDTRPDLALGPVQVRRRLVVFDAANVGIETATGRTTYQARGNSSIVSWQTEESWSDGTGSAGNPAYVPQPPHIYDDPEKGSVKEVLVVVNPTGSEVASTTINNGTGLVTEIEYLPRGDKLLTKKTTTFTLNGPELTSKVYDSATDSVITVTRQLVKASTAVPSITALWTDFRSEDVVSGVYKRFTTRIYPDLSAKTVNKGCRRERFIFPAILTTIDFDFLIQYVEDLPDNPGDFVVGRLIRTCNPVIIAERVRVVPHRIVRTFTTTAPNSSTATSGIYAINQVRNEYRGVLFSVVTGPVLQDATAWELDTGTDDPEWPNGGVVETYTALTSTPNATTYLADIGSEKNIDREFTQLASGLWAIDNIYVTLI